MLVRKKEADINSKRFKQFKRFSLDLYQKQYNIYNNELILTSKGKRTNSQIIDTISSKVPALPPVKGAPMRLQVQVNPTAEPAFSLRRYDFNYNQTVNIALNQRTTFHLSTHLQTNYGFGVYNVSPALSYQVRQTYYRVGLTWGPQISYYIMTSKKITNDWSASVLVSLSEKVQFSKSKVITTVSYKNNTLYGCIGNDRTIGFKTYPVHNDDTKLFINPYVRMYGVDNLEGCTAGFSKKLSETSRLRLDLTWTPWLLQFRSIALFKISDLLKLFLSYELQNANASLNFGLKFRNFYLGFPLINIDLLKEQEAIWATPLLFGMTCLILFWEQIREKVPFLKIKKETNKVDHQDANEKRQTDLKLISRRVKEIFNEEVRKNGLIINESYYGQKSAIANLVQQTGAEKIRSLFSPDLGQTLIDVTDSTRFYVDNSKLSLPKGTKTNLYGFYKLSLPNNEAPVLYFKFTYQGVERERFFDEHEAVSLP